MYDTAILGSGFAAFEIARVCSARGERVVVIERGQRAADRAAAGRSRVPSRREAVQGGAFGAGVPDGFENSARYIGLGGTAELWAGKWRPLDRIDVERARGNRAWPFTFEELDVWQRAVATDHGWPAWSLDAHDAELAQHVEEAGLRLAKIWEQSPPLRLRAQWVDLEQQGRIHLLCDARVEGPVFDATDSRLQAVQIVAGEHAHRIEARRFVVACGGIESVHVSHTLRWPESSPRRAASPEPRAYHGFMDHPKAHIGEITSMRDAPVVEHLLNSRHRGRLLALGLPEDELRAHALGNHTVALWRNPLEPGAPVRVSIHLEQEPEDENLVLPPPVGAVSWRISSATWHDCERFLATFVPRLSSLAGAFRLDPCPWFRGASHHLGALPMGATDTSVLDANLRFRDSANLYCASSAAFPAGGSANPTMAVIALARRLADHLGAA